MSAQLSSARLWTGPVAGLQTNPIPSGIRNPAYGILAIPSPL